MSKELAISLEHAAVRWEEACGHLAIATRLSYAGEVKRLLEHLAKLDVKNLADTTEAHWHGYLATVAGRRTKVDSKIRETLKASSALQAARITRAFFRYCWANRWLNWVPGLGSYRCVPREREPPLVMPPELLSILLESGASDDERAIRSRCAIGLAFWGGLRPREIATLLRSDVAIIGDGTAQLKPAWLKRKLALPHSLVSHLSRYDALRKERFGQLSNKAAAISGLKSLDPISVTVAWRILRGWPGDGTGNGVVQLGSRLVRASFQQLATDGIEGRLRAVEQQTGSRRSNFQMRVDEGPTGKQLTADVTLRMRGFA